MATANKIVNVANRVERAQALLLSQFKDKPNINAFVKVVVAELQELENALTDLQTARTLSGSYGVFLDEIGRRLKVPRGSYADPDYKTAIKIAMAKKTASATAQDILFLVELLTADPDATLTNNYPYLVELTGYLYCIADDPAGLEALADLFPINTRVRLVQHFGQSFKFGTSGRGFGSGSTLNNLAYHRYGTSDDSFTTSKTEITPPALVSAPYVLVAPYITGTNVEGNTLTLTVGEWGGNEPITFTYQWLLNNADIVGETSTTYVIDSGDIGQIISCRVTATNTYGSLAVITNEILVSSDPAPLPLLTSNIGMGNIYNSQLYTGGPPIISSVYLDVNSDGTTVRTGDTTINDQWASTTGAGVGNDYTLSYIVLEGQPFTNLNPEQLHDLSSSITLEVSTTAAGNSIKVGRYEFTIRSKTDPAVVVSKAITMSAEVADAIS